MTVAMAYHLNLRKRDTTEVALCNSYYFAPRFVARVSREPFVIKGGDFSSRQVALKFISNSDQSPQQKPGIILNDAAQWNIRVLLDGGPFRWEEVKPNGVGFHYTPNLGKRNGHILHVLKNRIAVNKIESFVVKGNPIRFELKTTQEGHFYMDVNVAAPRVMEPSFSIGRDQVAFAAAKIEDDRVRRDQASKIGQNREVQCNVFVHVQCLI